MPVGLAKLGHATIPNGMTGNSIKVAIHAPTVGVTIRIRTVPRRKLTANTLAK